MGKKKVTLAAPGFIISEQVDFWMTGGASVILISFILFYLWLGDQSTTRVSSTLAASAIFLQALINWPHFMGAYSLLYRDEANLKKYRMATVYVPIGLLLFIGYALSTPNSGLHFAEVNQDCAYVLWLVAAFYLAWHYTGQAWGMIASFAKLSNLEFLPLERGILRLSLRLLLAWHVVWGAQDLPRSWLGPIHDYLSTVLNILDAVSVLSFIVGIVIWLGVWKRIGKMPDRRILISWLAVYLWYLLLFFMPAAFMIVQFSHALQYVIFPLRAELNSRSERGLNSILWGLRYYMMLVFVGLLFFYVPELVVGERPGYTIAVMIACAISIHHYFVDSCIWRLKNRDVRTLLFSHLPSRKHLIGQ